MENKQPKLREPAVATADLWDRLKQAGIDLPANVSRIIIDANVGGVVKIYWSCFADKDAMDVIADVIVDLQRGRAVRAGKTIKAYADTTSLKDRYRTRVPTKKAK